ncbi:MAG: PIN domain-containing protein, partial [bacterium]
TKANSNPFRREFAEQVLSRSKIFIGCDEIIENLARNYSASGVRPLDALHLASAVSAGADYFCTCDDRLLKKSRLLDSRITQIKTPIELATELNL